jgi:hypothetical protein
LERQAYEAEKLLLLLLLPGKGAALLVFLRVGVVACMSQLGITCYIAI